jgi:Phosphotransferase enzyme family
VIGLGWLAGHRPPRGAVALVHGDFRNSTWSWTRGARVLDWELAHLGDPVEDLSWLCVRTWRFGSAELVGGFGSRSELLRGYAVGGGRVPDADTLPWWKVFGTLRWLVLCRLQAERARSGDGAHGRGSTTGRSPTSGRCDWPTEGTGCWPAEAAPTPPTSPTTCVSAPPTPRSRNSYASPVRWAIEESFPQRRTRPGWTTTKSVAIKRGIGTSPCPWPLPRFS